jgi:hypothetical protein
MATSQGVAPHRAWISVNGSQFPVLSGHVEQNGTRRSGTFSVTIPLYYPGAEATLAAIGDNQAAVTAQNVNGNGVLITGEVDTTDFHYGQNGTITISGRDNSIKLHNKKFNQTWTSKKTTDVVREVCSQVGLGCVITGGAGTNAGKEIDDEYNKIADGETGAAIVSKMAEQDNARWWMEGMTLHYDIDPQGGGGVSVNYRKGPPEKADFFTLSIKRNVQAGKQIKVTIESWHTKEKQMNSGEGTAGGNGGPVEYQYNIPGLKKGDTEERARNKAKEINRHELTVHVKVVGDPRVNVGSGLSVSGDTAFDQTYIIDSIHHHFGMGGYTMDVVARNSRGGGGGGIGASISEGAGGAAGGGAAATGGGTGGLQQNF